MADLALDPVARRLGFVTDEDWAAAHNHEEPRHVDGCPGCEEHWANVEAYGVLSDVWEKLIGFFTGRPCSFDALTLLICPECGDWGKYDGRVLVGGRGIYRCPQGHRWQNADEKPSNKGLALPPLRQAPDVGQGALGGHGMTEQTKGPSGMCSCDPKFQPDRKACRLSVYASLPSQGCKCRCHEPERAVETSVVADGDDA